MKLKRELGDAYPPSSEFQNAILAKSTITFADYQSAMEATASCAEAKWPMYRVSVVAPMTSMPQLLGFSVNSGTVEGDSSVSLSGPMTDSPADAGSISDSPSASGDSSNPSSGLAIGDSASTSSTTGDVDSMSAMNHDLSICEAMYSAQVEDWWKLNRPWALTGSALTQQRTAFVQCVTAAGQNIPADSSDATIFALVNDLDIYTQLTPTQQAGVSACDTQYQLYLQSINPNPLGGS
ncbi:MAG: hypothetical protein FWF43_03415 [Propionibacteriaceae bacterium]|nr:hypothetical protein [Propionibacteriaceae bacterium]